MLVRRLTCAPARSSASHAWTEPTKAAVCSGACASSEKLVRRLTRGWWRARKVATAARRCGKKAVRDARACARGSAAHGKEVYAAARVDRSRARAAEMQAE